MRRGMAKNPCCWARPNGSKRTPTNCGSMPRSISIPTATIAALLNMGGSHSLEQFINGVARDIEDPETKMTRVAAGSTEQRSREAKSADERKELRAAGRSAHRCARLGNGFHRLSRSPRGLPRWTWDMAARMNRGSITRSTTIFTGTRISPTRILFTGGRWRKRSEHR